MKHIAIIYEQELDIGGVETHLLSLFRRVDPAQYRFSIFAPTSNPYRQEAARLGVQVFPLAPYKPLSWRAFQRIHRLLHEEHVDLVHAHSPTAAVPARLAARTLGLPAVVTVHIPARDYHGVRHTLRANSGRKLYVFLDRVLNHSLTERLIYVSAQVYAQEIQEDAAPAERALVIPNGVDLSRFQSAASRTSLDPASSKAVEYEPGELDNSPSGDLRQEIWRDHHLPPELACNHLYLAV